MQTIEARWNAILNIIITVVNIQVAINCVEISFEPIRAKMLCSVIRKIFFCQDLNQESLGVILNRRCNSNLRLTSAERSASALYSLSVFASRRPSQKTYHTKSGAALSLSPN